MQSHNTSYLLRLDSIRFIAASMVLLFHGSVVQIAFLHSLNPFLVWIQEGHRGVNLFFALSGFLFALIAGKGQPIIYKNFIFNRFLRIFPLLIFVFLITAAINRDTWHAYQVLGLLLIQFNLSEFQSQPTLGTSWTISTEFIFYLLFPFLHQFANRYGERYLIGLISLFIIMRFLCLPLMPNELNYFFSILGRFDVLLVGMLIGRYYLQHSKVCINYYALPLTLLLLTAYFMLLSGMPHSPAYLVLHPPFEALLWSLLIVTTLNSKILWLSFEKLTARLGSVSYSMYLLHPFIIVNCQNLNLIENPLTNALIVSTMIILPSSIALAFLSFHVIEKPFLDFRVRYFS